MQPANSRYSPQIQMSQGSELGFKPQLQLGNRENIREVTGEVKKVIEVQKDNFNAKREKAFSYVLLAASAALIAMGVFLAVTNHLTGMGAMVAAVGLAVGGLAAYSYDQVLSKNEKASEINAVFTDAMDIRVMDCVNQQQQRSSEIEMRPPQRAFPQAMAPQFVPTAPSASLNWND